jgi:predicted dehydrogenase
MAEPLKIGIIGLGKMGGIRAKTVRENDDTILVSGTDPHPPAKGFEDMQILPDYRAVINSGVDAVFVCAPNRFIPEVTVAALDAGKHVFCEKPPGRNMDDIERIMAAEKRNPGRVLKIGFNHRYHFGIMEAKKIVESGKYGKILWVRGIYGKAEGSGNPNEWRRKSRACAPRPSGIFPWKTTPLPCCAMKKAALPCCTAPLPNGSIVLHSKSSCRTAT